MQKAFNFLKVILSKSIKNISVMNVIFLFRIFTLPVICTLFYFTASDREIINKVIIIIGLIVSYTAFTILQYYNYNNKRHMLILTVVETLGNSIFIIISGGFSSPFIWYFINTIFITAVYSSYSISIVSAVPYFLSATFTTAVIISPIYNKDIVRLYLNTAFSYIIVVWAILLLIRYTMKVKEKSDSLTIMNKELENARLRVEKTLKLSMDLYETVNLFALNSNENILQLLVDHMKSLTGYQRLMFIQMSPVDKKGTYVSSGLLQDEEESIYQNALKVVENKSAYFKKGFYYKENDLLIHFVMYEGDLCGIFVTVMNEIGNQFNENLVFQTDKNDERLLDQTDVVATYMQIAGMLLKKMEFDDMEEQLLISEEQNRIANEIHDLVLQKLFALSCKLFIMSKENDINTIMNMREDLLGVRQSVDIIMKELRDAVYGMSWSKNGQDTFITKLNNYIDELKYLHSIEINLIIEGDTQKISANQKHNIYRVICEAINNSIRHGYAKFIEVSINVNNTITSIFISDNGKGFDFNKLENKIDKGLGLNNICRIVENNQGHIEFKSNAPKGTRIYITVPHKSAV